MDDKIGGHGMVDMYKSIVEFDHVAAGLELIVIVSGEDGTTFVVTSTEKVMPT